MYFYCQVMSFESVQKLHAVKYDEISVIVIASIDVKQYSCAFGLDFL